MKRACKNCDNWHKNPLGLAGQCRGDLPKAFLIGMLPDGQALYGTAFPETGPDVRCAKFMEKTNEPDTD